MVYVLFVLGLVVLVAGADFLVRGASGFASQMNIPPLVVGLTIVAFGTSMPELAVSVRSALSGQAGIAVGNVIGSNIFNVLFILGISAVITPLAVSLKMIRFDIPIMISAALMMFFMSMDGIIGRGDGILLFFCIIAYTVWLYMQGKAESETAIPSGPYDQNRNTGGRAVFLYIFHICVGLVFLSMGSKWLVDGAVFMARRVGVSELTIGLTIIAAGTSLPEGASSVMAAFKGERDIAIGNVVGSNIFNILSVLGLSGIVSASGIPVDTIALHFDIPAMIAVSVLCLPIFFTHGKIERWEGALFLGYYSAYTVYLLLVASHHRMLESYRFVMSFAVIPLTVIAVLLSVYYHRRKEG